MITTLNSAVSVSKEAWKKELRRFLRVNRETDKGNSEEMGAECPYCGRKVREEDLRTRFFMGKICVQCDKERIRRKETATNLAKQCLENMHSIYGVERWKKIKVDLAFRWPAMRKHQFPRYNADVKYRKRWKCFQDKLSVARGLPVTAAEGAIAFTLLEQYISSCLLGEGGRFKKFLIKLKKKDIEGLAVWCTIHYLYVVKSNEYAKRYEEALTREDKNVYQNWKDSLGTPLSYNFLQLGQVIEEKLK